jgi:hypothetical protein
LWTFHDGQFAPGIIQGYGYSPIETQFHSVIPWAAAFGWAMILATFSDWAKHRFAFAIGSIIVSIAGKSEKRNRRIASGSGSISML